MSNADWTSKPFALCPTPTSTLPKGEKPSIFVDLASGMALTHNVIIRSLNAIHQQAPYIPPAEIQPFLSFAQTWVSVLAAHHDGEEAVCFPAIEAMTGQQGIMHANVEQHAVFHGAVVDLGSYLDSCQKDPTLYDGAKIREMLDGFGPALIQHLHDEIPTLLALERFGADKLKGLHAVFEKEAQQNMSKVGLAGMMLVFLSHDVTYEDGLWAGWPPVPWVMLLAIRNVVYWFHSDWWRFAPTDRYGVPQAQYAVPAGQ